MPKTCQTFCSSLKCSNFYLCRSEACKRSLQIQLLDRLEQLLPVNPLHVFPSLLDATFQHKQESLQPFFSPIPPPTQTNTQFGDTNDQNHLQVILNCRIFDSKVFVCNVKFIRLLYTLYTHITKKFLAHSYLTYNRWRSYSYIANNHKHFPPSHLNVLSQIKTIF